MLTFAAIELKYSYKIRHTKTTKYRNHKKPLQVMLWLVCTISIPFFLVFVCSFFLAK